MHATVNSQGHIAVPKEIREKLGLQAGDRMKVFLDAKGLHLVPEKVAESNLGGLAGSLAHLAKARPVTVEEMNEAIRTRTRRAFP